MGQARLRVVEFDRGLIQLEVPVAGIRLRAFSQSVASRFRCKRSEALGDFEILFKNARSDTPVMVVATGRDIA